MDASGSRDYGLYSLALISLGRGLLLVVARREDCSCSTCSGFGSSSTSEIRAPEWIQGFSQWSSQRSMDPSIANMDGRVLEIMSLEDRSSLASFPLSSDGDQSAKEIIDSTGLFSSSQNWGLPCFSMELLPCSTALVISIGQSMALVVRVSPPSSLAALTRLGEGLMPLLTDHGLPPPLNMDLAHQFSENVRLLQESLAYLNLDQWRNSPREDQFDENEYFQYPPSPALSSSSVSVLSESGQMAEVPRGQTARKLNLTGKPRRKRHVPRFGDRECVKCKIRETTQWREGGTLCNVCSLRKRRRLLRQQEQQRDARP
jgi:hypothetical protein